MQRDRAQRRRDPSGGGHFLIGGPIAKFVGTIEAAFWQGAGHLAVDQIDRPVYRIPAIADRGGPALYLYRV
ncbi:hypothetical protein GCM10023208_15480 [Erythrobacter westpacificensis]|uniref:Uncharacterized protein n=1 Tax=Erythrobacter westpacificensis TaxID=1055231 RepID=A0ABP9KD92_9SPHN